MEFTLTLDGPKDRYGRCAFSLEWSDGCRKRGQCFFADPGKHTRRLGEAGHKVEVRDASAAKQDCKAPERSKA